MDWFIFLAIELGDFSILPENGWGDFLWFGIGATILTGLTMVVLRWNKQSRPDPFEDGMFDRTSDEQAQTMEWQARPQEQTENQPTSEDKTPWAD